MADFTNITNAQVDPGSPIDTALMTALRDNTEYNKSLISSTVISGSPSVIDFTFDPSLYSSIVFRFGNVKGAADFDQLYFTTSSNGGVSFDNAASDYEYITNLGTTTTTSVVRFASAVGNAATDGGFCGDMIVYSPNISAHTYMSCIGAASNASNTLEAHYTLGKRSSVGIVNAVRFSSLFGNFANGGLITMHGVRN